MNAPRVLCLTDHGDTLNSIRPEVEMMIGARRAGIELEIMTQTDSVYAGPMADAGIVLHANVIEKKFDRRAVRALGELMDARNYDILHMFNNKAIVCGIRAARGRSVRLVTYRGQTGNISRWDPSCYLTHLHPRVDTITCVSESVRKDIAAQLRQPEKAVLLYKGHDLAWYRERPADLGEFGLRAEDFVVAVVTNMRPRKGVRFVIESAQHLPADAPIRFLLVGAGMDSEEVRAAASAYPGRFVLAGFRTDAPALVAASQASLLAATKGEGLPKSVIESMAYGVAPIATATGGSPELIVDGECGLVIQPSSSEAIADAVLELWRHPDRTRAMGERARERIATHFNVSDSIEQLVALYRRLADT